MPLKKVAGGGIQACKIAAAGFTSSQERSRESLAEIERNGPLRISVKQMEVANY